MLNLEAHWVLYGYPWMKCPVGVFGTENIWSQNSEDWLMSEVGAALNGDGDCVNAIAVNIRTSKAINISQIVPAKQTWMNQFNPSQTATEFRYNGSGPGFSNGVQKSADRPALWCSSQEDVWTQLWHYIQDRQTDNQYWSDLLGLPLCEIPSSAVRQSAGGCTHGISPAIAGTSGLRVNLPGSGPCSAAVTDMSGRAVARLTGSGPELRLPRLATGAYCLLANRPGASYRARFAAR
jgi:hypothetical protein